MRNGWKDLLGNITIVLAFLSNIAALAGKDWVPTFVLHISIVLFSIFFTYALYQWYRLKSAKKKKKKTVKEIRINKFIAFSSGPLLTFSIVILVFGLHKSCKFDKSKIGIGISIFNNEQLSVRVKNRLQTLGVGNDEDSLRQVEHLPKDYMQTIHDPDFPKELKKICLRSGIMLSGEETDKTHTYVKIRLRNFFDSAGVRRQNQVFEYETPEKQQFKIRTEANELANYLYGLIKFQNYQNEQAIIAFTKALANEENKGDSAFLSLNYSFLANLYVRAQQVENAISNNLRALLLDRKNYSAMINLILGYKSQGDTEQANYYSDQLPSEYKPKLDSLSEYVTVIKPEDEPELQDTTMTENDLDQGVSEALKLTSEILHYDSAVEETQNSLIEKEKINAIITPQAQGPDRKIDTQKAVLLNDTIQALREELDNLRRQKKETFEKVLLQEFYSSISIMANVKSGMFAKNTGKPVKLNPFNSQRIKSRRIKDIYLVANLPEGAKRYLFKYSLTYYSESNGEPKPIVDEKFQARIDLEKHLYYGDKLEFRIENPLGWSKGYYELRLYYEMDLSFFAFNRPIRFKLD